MICYRWSIFAFKDHVFAVVCFAIVAVNVWRFAAASCNYTKLRSPKSVAIVNTFRASDFPNTVNNQCHATITDVIEVSMIRPAFSKIFEYKWLNLFNEFFDIYWYIGVFIDGDFYKFYLNIRKLKICSTFIYFMN